MEGGEVWEVGRCGSGGRWGGVGGIDYIIIPL